MLWQSVRLFYGWGAPNSDGASLIASNVHDAITLPDGSPDTSFFNDGYLGENWWVGF